MSEFHFYEPKDGHRLPHDPFKAIVAPRPIGWISTVDREGRVNLAPYSFFNAFCDTPPIIGFSSSGRKDSQRNVEETGEFVFNLARRRQAEAMNRVLPAGVQNLIRRCRPRRGPGSRWGRRAGYRDCPQKRPLGNTLPGSALTCAFAGTILRWLRSRNAQGFGVVNPRSCPRLAATETPVVNPGGVPRSLPTARVPGFPADAASADFSALIGQSLI
jgi:hypothetical protein